MLVDIKSRLSKVYHRDLFLWNQKVLSIFANQIAFYLSFDWCTGIFVQRYK